MKAYNIPYTGLKLGKHAFEFDLNSEFFASFDYQNIMACDIRINVLLEKSEVMIVANMEAQGTVKVHCDRCNDPFHLPIQCDSRIIFKYTDEEIDEEMIIGLLPSEHELKMAEPFFQMIVLNLPISFNHEDEDDCNQEMIDLLDGYRYFDETEEEEDEDIDPRWNALKNLNKDKNK